MKFDGGKRCQREMSCVDFIEALVLCWLEFVVAQRNFIKEER